ncbi:hypothetical protein CPLU01_00710 [Colletotrichum plurivorum]|uniref:Uncharacterized protein n=1 Tax=Colletotrichum plurivorum TaxID=2175906 RepID=A0A8H6NRK3_9PEZI|nr:hypothetical protein CPLU01_00710 [Colletotrichum plurivorum]
MSTPSTSSPTAPFPSFEERRKANQPVALTVEAKRIFWKLQGPLSDNVSVTRDWRDRESPREPFVHQDSAGNITSWHPVAQAPLTEPKVGSVTVRVDVLERWQDEWLKRHERHAHPDDKHNVFGELNAELYDESGEEDEDEDEGPQLLRCCNTDRPRKAPRLVVKPSSTEGYVTVRDYISTVHPWLLGQRKNIIQADNVWDDKKPVHYERLAVGCAWPNRLMIMDEERYVSLLGPRKTVVVDAATAPLIERMRQNPPPPFNYQNLYRAPSDVTRDSQARQ